MKRAKTFKEIRKKITEIKPFLREEYGVVNVKVFGSFARNEQALDSDLDLIVDLEKPLGFAFLDLCEFLEKEFQLKVDVLTARTLQTRFAKYIQKDLIDV